MRGLARKALEWAASLRAPDESDLREWAARGDWPSLLLALKSPNRFTPRDLSSLAGELGAQERAPSSVLEALIEAGVGPFDSICRSQRGYVSVSESLLEALERRADWEAWARAAARVEDPKQAQAMRDLDRTRPILGRSAARLKLEARPPGGEPSAAARAWMSGAQALMRAGASHFASANGPEALFYKGLEGSVSLGPAERFINARPESADSVWLLEGALAGGAPVFGPCSGRAQGPLLMSAALHGAIHCAQALARAGADPRSRSGDGRGAAHWACQGVGERAVEAGAWRAGAGAREMALLARLREMGVDFDLQDERGERPRDALARSLAGFAGRAEVLMAYDAASSEWEARGIGEAIERAPKGGAPSPSARL